MFPIKLLFVLGSVTVLFLTGDAAGAVCRQKASRPTIPLLPGKPGKNGVPGQPGPKGEMGVSGKNGSDGAPGPQGPVGPTGPRGISGMNGTDGERGPVGPSGIIGPPGVDGRDGVDGRNGSDGLPGPPGTVAETVIEQLRGEILEEVQRLICPGSKERYPAISCKEIIECNPLAPSGDYWINGSTGLVQVYCLMQTTDCGNTTGGWIRVAYVDMTVASNTCPPELSYTVASNVRICERSQSGCVSISFPTHGVNYAKVCGRVRGYHFSTGEAFQRGVSSIEDSYVDGLSVMHGSPRKHIWTFAVGNSKVISDNGNCPCAASPGHAAPTAIVRNEYFCESGSTGKSYQLRQWHLDDPLWDSQGCVNGSTCCNRGGPWFTTTLSQEVSDAIEMRFCLDEAASDEEIGIDQLELYVY